ncbi:CBN-NAS-31 protein [Aphelenchoides avenae]|nr:CBN-NAS-31 protein [Aphelenchus avenae]
MKGLFVFVALCVAVGFAVSDNPAEVRKKFLEEVKSRQPDAYKAILRKAAKARHAPRNRKPATIPPEIAEQVKELEENARRDMQISVKEGEVPSIPSVNKPFADLLFQGDMLLTEEQEKEQEQEHGNGIRAKRQVQTGPEYPKNKWAPGVPISYRFESSIDSYTRDLIRKSFKFWEEHSCLSFAENGTALPRLRFFKGQGCYSLVGKVYQQEEQEISIGDGCEMFGTVTHEIAHSLGLFHHHSRSDRDDFITVLTANLRPGWDRQFAKETPAGSSNLGVHYDYGSNMHYTGFDPATNKIMFLAKDKHYQHTMGNHYGPVFSDILLLNRYYQCSDKCAGQVTCKNGGFPHPRNCRTCICPDGFGGNDCSERAAPESGAPADCGRIVQATAQVQTLSGSVKSGPLGGPSNIADRHAVCYYHIRAPTGKRIEIKMNKFFGSCMNECVLGGVEIKYDNLTRVGAQ